MPRYMIQRKLGQVTDAQLQEAAVHAKEIREAQFSDIDWDHSHVVRTDEGLETYCLYNADSVERVLEHARAAGLPADRVFEVHMDVNPRNL